MISVEAGHPGRYTEPPCRRLLSSRLLGWSPARAVPRGPSGQQQSSCCTSCWLRSFQPTALPSADCSAVRSRHLGLCAGGFWDTCRGNAPGQSLSWHPPARCPGAEPGQHSRHQPNSTVLLLLHRGDFHHVGYGQAGPGRWARGPGTELPLSRAGPRAGNRPWLTHQTHKILLDKNFLLYATRTAFRDPKQVFSIILPMRVMSLGVGPWSSADHRS